MLEIKDLSFNFGKTKVFDGFDLKVPKGQVCLITGINGVGKSTLLRLVAGVLNPASGTIEIDTGTGEDPRRRIGFISDEPRLYQSLRVGQAIDFHMSANDLKNFDDTLLQHTKIRSDQRIKELSTGQKIILHLSLILSTEPELFLIDEVIHSIDAYLRRLFLETLIKLLSQRRITVILVNLNFHDIEHIIDRIILLKSGEIVVDESIDNLKAKVKKVVGKRPPQSLDILARLDFSGHSEFYVYPYYPDVGIEDSSRIVDLNLTEIVTAFIGGEYA
ncbi:MAG: ABC transporter ATP-binding protein [Candidatus Aminicenantaceae bacterium]